jgi:hypothetical protein
MIVRIVKHGMYKKLYKAKTILPHKTGCIECGLRGDENFCNITCRFCIRIYEKNKEIIEACGRISITDQLLILNHICDVKGDVVHFAGVFANPFIGFSISRWPVFVGQRSVSPIAYSSSLNPTFIINYLKFDKELYSEMERSICIRCVIRYAESGKWIILDKHYPDYQIRDNSHGIKEEMIKNVMRTYGYL